MMLLQPFSICSQSFATTTATVFCSIQSKQCEQNSHTRAKRPILKFYAMPFLQQPSHGRHLGDGVEGSLEPQGFAIHFFM